MHDAGEGDVKKRGSAERVTPEPTPWRRWLEIGLGALGMRQEDFWNQALHEWDARVAGYIEANGGGRDEDLKMSDFDELAEAFPDEPAPT